MCLAVPMKLTSADGLVGRASMDGVARKVALDLVPQAKVGDWVIVHAGYAIELLDEAVALETLQIIEQALGDDL